MINQFDLATGEWIKVTEAEFDTAHGINVDDETTLEELDEAYATSNSTNTDIEPLYDITDLTGATLRIALPQDAVTAFITDQDIRDQFLVVGTEDTIDGATWLYLVDGLE